MTKVHDIASTLPNTGSLTHQGHKAAVMLDIGMLARSDFRHLDPGPLRQPLAYFELV